MTVALALTLAAVLLHVAFDVRAPGLADVPGAMDEAVYVQSGYDFASDLHDGRPGKILEDRSIAEHPVFTRLLFAGAILTDWAIRGYAPLPLQEQNRHYQLSFHATSSFTRYLQDARIVSSVCGVALVLLLTLYSPLAGLFALLSTVVLSYTTRAYLEAPGMLFGALAVILYVTAKGTGQGLRPRSLSLMGVTLGLATAAKYYYIIAGAAIILDMVLFSSDPLRRRLTRVLWLVCAAFLAFSLADLPFYTQGLPRSLHLLRANGIEYASGWAQTSQVLHRHWYSEISMLGQGFRSWYPAYRQPFLLSIDPLIMALSILGLVTGYRGRSAITAWLAATAAFLIFYPVKYEQYTALAIVPICLFAACGVEFLWRRIVNRQLPAPFSILS